MASPGVPFSIGSSLPNTTSASGTLKMLSDLVQSSLRPVKSNASSSSGFGEGSNSSIETSPHLVRDNCEIPDISLLMGSETVLRTSLNQTATPFGGRKIACQRCGGEFNNWFEALTHLAMELGLIPSNGKTSMFSSDPSMHLKKEVCEDSFRQPEPVKAKPLRCSVCNQKFLAESELTKHLRTHTGKGPFVCAICRRSFDQTAHLEIHMRTHNLGTAFPCLHCEKSFTSRLEVMRHMKLHRQSGMVLP